MSFIDSSFILFAIVFFCIYFSLARKSNLQRFVLFASGILLYGFYSRKFLICLVVIALADFKLGILIDQSEKKSKKKLYLITSICLNLGLLIFTKYTHFFFDVFKQLFFAESTKSNPFSTEMPLGISFYTFESISYVVDIYRGKIKPTRKWINYGAFLSYFPHLVSGPIVRPKEFLTQLEHNREYRPWVIATGLKLILLGYFKKIVIADHFAPLADLVFSKQTQDPFHILLGVFSFTIQIYTDFSAYTNIAQGLAYLIGIRLPDNFNIPYISLGLRDFWKRWHISLSSWLRDYLYISLGGSKKGMLRTLFALMVTMALGGLWHGANWTFLIWGIYHGVLLCSEHLAHSKKILHLEKWKISGRWITLILVMGGWVIFRAKNLDEAFFVFRATKNLFLTHYLSILGCFGSFLILDRAKLQDKLGQYLYSASVLLIVLVLLQRGMSNAQFEIHWIHYLSAVCFSFGLIHEILPKNLRYFAAKPIVNIGASVFMICLILASVVQARSQFIYFQF